MREPVGREAVDDAERVAELVIEAGPDNSSGQRVAHVGDALAHVIPGVADLPGVGALLQIDENRGDAGNRSAADEIEMRGFLQRALKPLRHLIERVLDRRAGPRGLNHHGLDDEGRILAAPEPDE